MDVHRVQWTDWRLMAYWRGCHHRNALHPPVTNLSTVLLSLQLLFDHSILYLLILAPFVLEPDPDDPRTQPGHLRQLLFHQRVWTGVGAIASFEDVQLFLAENSPRPSCFSHASLVLLSCRNITERVS